MTARWQSRVLLADIPLQYVQVPVGIAGDVLGAVARLDFAEVQA